MRIVQSRSSRVGMVAVLAGAALLAGCSSDGGEGEGAASTNIPPASVPAATPMDGEDLAALTAQVDDAPGCDQLDATRCLLPFPSDVFVADDPDTDTGVRVAFPVEAMPVNSGGTPIDPEGWTANDGFSPGTPIFVHLTGPTGADPDLEASGVAGIGTIAASVEDASPVVLLDVDAGERVPQWTELDSNAPDGERLLIVRPARNLVEGHRHVVAIRGLVDVGGADIEPTVAFRAYRDNLTTDIDAIEQRRPAMEQVFADLGAIGVGRSGLQVAWDFTVASEANLSEPVLAMRDDALGSYGEDGAPAFTVTEVVEAPNEDVDEGIARVVRGTFTVPIYLTGDGSPGSTANDPDGDGIPERNGEAQAAFACQVPTSSLTEPAGPVVYGHGLLGDHGEVESGHVARTAAEANLVYCATDWWGMSEADLITVAGILGDLSNFPQLADRSMQGILNAVLLGRLVRSEAGLVTDPAFQNDAGEPVIATGEAYYDGNSQGGIMGGAATAISTEWTKAVLGVPGMNYSTLLRRSVDFVGQPGEIGFEDVLVPAYPDPIDQNLAYGLIQMLWDRGETNGYAAHLTDDPLAETPSHTVILHVAFGDHQVAPVTAEVEARSAGMGLRWPALADGRHPDAEPFFGLDQITEYPTDRSVLVYWDSGTLPNPPGNITVLEDEAWLAECSADDEAVPCADPHEDPRRQDAAIAQKDAFFAPDGVVIDPCDGQPCAAVPRSVSGR